MTRAALAGLNPARAHELATRISDSSPDDTLVAALAASASRGLRDTGARSGRGDLYRAAALTAQSALAGKRWIDAIRALPLLQPSGMARVSAVIGAYARQAPG
jgi:hypothetical protein